MFLKTQILMMYAESAIHAGTGSDLGAVDLPIQRERKTKYPIIQASSVKGALRSHVKDSADGKDVQAVFGKELKNSDPNQASTMHAGALSAGDARILLFPVRALKGVFVWVTSPLVLARFRYDLTLAGVTQDVPSDVPKPEEVGQALVSATSLLLNDKSIVLEEFSFSAKQDQLTNGWATYFGKVLPGGADAYWQKRIENHLVVLGEDDFRDFVQYTTEVVTRIKLSDETKTVEKGALFSQELLPSDSVMYSLVNASMLRTSDTTISTGTAQQQAEAVLNWAAMHIKSRIQIGADETVGRGLMALKWLGAN